jgi:ADP-ribose pyrophosphatase|nr:MAG: ADP-ribose pyrophosphatase [Candidatus Nanosalinarum sp. J07AB56]
MAHRNISEKDWGLIVEKVPICSVDLIILDSDEEKFVLGYRNSEVAGESWFVPGGRVRKNEGLREAAKRVSKEETGLDVDIVEKLGSYQHFYDESDVGAESGKHYIANAFIVSPREGEELEKDEQHRELKWFSDRPDDTHKYTKRYLEDADLP